MTSLSYIYITYPEQWVWRHVLQDVCQFACPGAGFMKPLRTFFVLGFIKTYYLCCVRLLFFPKLLTWPRKPALSYVILLPTLTICLCALHLLSNGNQKALVNMIFNSIVFGESEFSKKTNSAAHAMTHIRADSRIIRPVSGLRYMARLHAIGADWVLDTRILL